MTPRVLYIGGLGRSGSTLLDLLLGADPDTCSVGELTHLWTRGAAYNERCGCGQRFHSCTFWSEVGQRAFGGWDSPEAERAAALHHLVDRNRYVPLMLVPRLWPSYRRRLHEYAGALSRVYRSVAATSGATTVVDSSKHASTAFLLRHLQGRQIDLTVVHLIRDSRAVGHSWSKVVPKPEATDEVAFMDRVPPARIALRWMSYNLLFHLLAGLGTPTTRLHYEDFVTDPNRVAARIRGTTPLNGGGSAQESLIELPNAHTVAGNPLRFRRGPLSVARDDAWRTAQPRKHRWLISTLTWPLAVVYGYLGAGVRSPASTPPVARIVPAAPASPHWPSVSVVVPTHGRPAFVREAIAAALQQEYEGIIEVVVVHDGEDVDGSLAQDGATRRVRPIPNGRSRGLAGARNAGVEAATGELVAFCDDDDHFEPGKLRTQAEALMDNPGIDVAVGAVVLDDDGTRRHRCPPGPTLTLDDLVRDRVMAAHPSTVMVRRDAFWTRIGPVDERIPGSYAEDYEWLLRAAADRTVLVVPRAVTNVRWGVGTSLFAQRWGAMCDAIDYLIERHPELRGCNRGLARLYGRKAFALAAMGETSSARHWARRSWSLNPRERRAYVAWLATTRTVRPETLLRAAHARGRGI